MRTWTMAGWSSMGGETRSVLGHGIATPTATVTGAGPGPVVVPDALVYLDTTGRRSVHGRVIASTIARTSESTVTIGADPWLASASPSIVTFPSPTITIFPTPSCRLCGQSSIRVPLIHDPGIGCQEKRRIRRRCLFEHNFCRRRGSPSQMMTVRRMGKRAGHAVIVGV